MTRKYFSTVTCFAFIILLAFGCTKKPGVNKCLSYTKAPVTKIEGPTTALVTQNINLTVSFGCFNGCGQFGNFEETTNGNTTTINVNAKYEGCICTQDTPIRQTIYSFKRTQPGTYDLKFLQTDNNYLTYTITVQ